MNVIQQNSTPKKGKVHVVTFRLTPADLMEYERFCVSEQIRMSDLIRDALKTKVQALDEMPGIEFITENN